MLFKEFNWRLGGHHQRIRQVPFNNPIIITTTTTTTTFHRLVLSCLNIIETVGQVIIDFFYFDLQLRGKWSKKKRPNQSGQMMKTTTLTKITETEEVEDNRQQHLEDSMDNRTRSNNNNRPSRFHHRHINGHRPITANRAAIHTTKRCHLQAALQAEQSLLHQISISILPSSSSI